MARDFTHATIVLDRSASMRSIKEGTLAGINELIAEQKKHGDGCWTLALFDEPQKNQYASAVHRGYPQAGLEEPFPLIVYEDKPQADIEPLLDSQFVPRGNTALYDAVCLTIDKTGRKLAAMPEAMRPDKVVIIIVTDGEENASRMFTKEDMRKRIETQQNVYSWNFIFTAANQDAIMAAESYGIKTTSAMNFEATNKGTSQAYSQISRGMCSLKSVGSYALPANA